MINGNKSKKSDKIMVLQVQILNLKYIKITTLERHIST